MSISVPNITNVTRPFSKGYGVAINDNLYRLVISQAVDFPLVQVNIDRPDRIDTAVTPEEMVDEFGNRFGRNDFRGGEGILYAHRRNNPPNAERRFWRSRNIITNPPQTINEPAPISLAHRFDTITENLGVDDSSLLHYVAGLGILFHIHDDSITEYPDPLVSDPTTTSSTTTPDTGTAPIHGITNLGDEVYVGVEDDGVYLRDPGTGDWSSYSSLNTGRLWSAKGRLLGTKFDPTDDPIDHHRELHEVREGANSVLISTLPPGEQWTGVAESGPFILATATDGKVYSFSLDEDTADLQEVGQSSLSNQRISSIDSFADQVIIGTYQPTADLNIKRLWRGEVTQAGTIGNLQLVKRWQCGEESGIDPFRGVVGLHNNNNFAHFLVVNDSIVEYWAYSYADGGLSNIRSFPATDSANDFIMIGDRAFALINHDLLREDPNSYVSEGSFVTPFADFFNASDKTWVSVEISLNQTPLPSGTSIELHYSTDPDSGRDIDSDDWTNFATILPSTARNRFQLPDVVGRSFAIKMVLKSEPTAANTPEVTSYTVSALRTSHEVILRLPIDVSDTIRKRGFRGRRLKGMGEAVYRALRELEGSRVTVELFKPHEHVRGVVEVVDSPKITPAVTPHHGVYFSLIRIRGERISVSPTASSSEGAMGIGTMGIMRMGGNPS